MSIDSRSPLAVTRRDQILDLLCQHGTVRVSELADQLDVTPMTVRRDIALLAEAGLLRRVHGGATLAADVPRVAAPDAPVERAPDAVHTAVRRIGMLVPSLDYYWPGVVRGTEEVARSCGLRVMLRGSSYDSDEDRTQIARLLEHGRVDGLIVAPNMTAPHAQDTIDWLVGCGVPVVLVEREAVASFRHQPLESVVSDHVTGAAVAVRQLGQHRSPSRRVVDQCPEPAQRGRPSRLAPSQRRGRPVRRGRGGRVARPGPGVEGRPRDRRGPRPMPHDWHDRPAKSVPTSRRSASRSIANGAVSTCPATFRSSPTTTRSRDCSAHL